MSRAITHRPDAVDVQLDADFRVVGAEPETSGEDDS